ncbi:MAG: hypothetical protein LBB26_01280 [Puniceicoccales bacterium]|jgi:hypothetical protein|nr:hypothetical protein [Puniceicoccales bacterium]
MKNVTATTASVTDIFDDDWELQTVSSPRIGAWLQTGIPIFWGISCVFTTGQPAANRGSHLKNISIR